MNFYTLIDNFESVFNPLLAQYIRSILKAVGLFAGVITSIYVLYKVVKVFIGDSEKIEGATLVRPSLILGAIVLYLPLVDLVIEKPIEIFNDIVLDGLQATTGISDINSIREAARGKLQYTQDSDTAGGNGIHDILQVNPFLELFHLVLFFIGTIAAGYVIFSQLLIKAIHIILGPFALAFALIPGNERVLGNWFQSTLSVFMWIPVLNIVRAIIILVPVNEDAAGGILGRPNLDLDKPDILFSMVFQIAMIFIIFKVPQFANMLVAQGSSMGQQLGSTLTYQLKSSAVSAGMSKLGVGGGEAIDNPNQRGAGGK